MNLMIQQGWQCPCCSKVYSPTTPMCFYCPPKVTVASNSIPQREWTGLTDEEIVRTRGRFNGTLDVQFKEFAYLIEAKLKEKNR